MVWKYWLWQFVSSAARKFVNSTYSAKTISSTARSFVNNLMLFQITTWIGSEHKYDKLADWVIKLTNLRVAVQPHLSSS